MHRVTAFVASAVRHGFLLDFTAEEKSRMRMEAKFEGTTGCKPMAREPIADGCRRRGHRRGGARP